MRAATAETVPNETRELLLEAAMTAFAENGFEGTSTRDIVARAGLNHGLIRYHFGSKAKLWRAAVDRAFDELRAGLESVLRDPGIVDDRARIAELVRDHVRFVARHPEFVRLMFEEGKRRGPRMRWMVDRHVEPIYKALSTLFERARKGGVLRSDFSPVHFFYAAAGAVGVIYHQAEECRRIAGVDPFDSAAIEAHADVVETMVLAALSDSRRKET